MRRALLLITILALVLAPAFAQHEGEHKAPGHGQAAEGSHGEGGHSNLGVWKWANFAILAGIVGYVLAKNGGAFFRSRNEQILKDISDAEKVRQDAEARAAEVDRKLASLDAEIEALRAGSRQQAAAEGERARAAAETQMAKIREHGEQEIEAAGKSARQELKRYAAELAVNMARERIRAGMNSQTDDALVRSFVEGLEHVRNRPQTG
jgi:F-type H+-transporting ATPase subunit b